MRRAPLVLLLWGLLCAPATEGCRRHRSAHAPRPTRPTPRHASAPPRCGPDTPARGRETELPLPSPPLALGLGPLDARAQTLLVAHTQEELFVARSAAGPLRRVGLVGSRAPLGPELSVFEYRGGWLVPALRVPPPSPPALVAWSFDRAGESTQEPAQLVLDGGDRSAVAAVEGDALSVVWPTEGALSFARLGEGRRNLLPSGVAAHALALVQRGDGALVAWSDEQDRRPVLRLAAWRDAEAPRELNVAVLPAPVDAVLARWEGERLVLLLREVGPAHRLLRTDYAVDAALSTARRERDFTSLAETGGAHLRGTASTGPTEVLFDAPGGALRWAEVGPEGLRRSREVALEGCASPRSLAWRRGAAGSVLAVGCGAAVRVLRFDGGGCPGGE